MFDVLVAGRAVWDEWLDLPPDAPDHVWFGGPGANVAVHLASFGLRPYLVTIFGTDSFSRRYQEYLEAAGVNISLSQTISGDLPRCEMWLTKQGTYQWAAGLDGLQRLSQLPIDKLAKNSRSIFLADLPLTGLTEIGPETLAACSPQLTLRQGLSPMDKVLGLPWKCVFVNHKEAETVEDLAGQTLVEISQQTAPMMWWVTRRAEDTLLIQNGRTKNHPVPATHVINPIGGGDAFAAGAWAAVLAGLTAEQAAVVGHACAAEVVSQVGCQVPADILRAVWTRHGGGTLAHVESEKPR